MVEENLVVIGRRPPRSFFNKRYLKFELRGGLDIEGKIIALNAKGDNFLSLEGFRASVNITMVGGYVLPEMTAEIHNLPEGLTTILSTLGIYNLSFGVLCNQIIVYASTDHSDPENPFYVKIFEGSIINAYADYGTAPESVFYIQAQQLGGLNLRGLPAIAFEGQVSKEDVIKAIIDNFKQSLNANIINPPDEKGVFHDKKASITIPLKAVKNCGVKGFLTNPHYYGDLTTQLYKVAAEGQFLISASQDGILYMYPQGSSITPEDQEQKLPLFSSSFGMIGYPQYCSQGLIIRSIFRPDLLFGQAIEVYSTLKPACGIWPSMVSMQHNLSTLIPNGAWETQLVVAKRQIEGSITDDNYTNQS